MRVADLAQLLDVLVVGLAEVVPDARVRRHDVRLIAAVGDHVVRALLQPQVLAAEVPADVHQLDGVERGAAAPRRAGRVRALALERVLDRHEPGADAVAPADAEVACRRARRATTSTSLNTPARTKYALAPTSSSATPGQSLSVPGSFSRSMIFFTASAAVMFSGTPELCPSPWPGAPSIIGS